MSASSSPTAALPENHQTKICHSVPIFEAEVVFYITVYMNVKSTPRA